MPSTVILSELPLYMQEGSYSARQDRQLFDALFEEGVWNVDADALKVTQHGAGGLSVDVDEGLYLVQGDDQAAQGKYLGRSGSTVELSIAAGDPANPRIDRVILEVRDNNANAGGFSDARLRVVQGVPGAVPVAPAVPASAISLARIAVAANAVAVLTAHITDERVQVVTTLETPAVGILAYHEAVGGAGVATTLVQADVDAARCFVTVDVPANGKVLVQVEAALNASSNAAPVFWGLREGAANVATEKQMLAPLDAGGDGNQWMRASFVLEGVAPGVHTYKLSQRHANAAGSTTVPGCLMTASALP